MHYLDFVQILVFRELRKKHLLNIDIGRCVGKSSLYKGVGDISYHISFLIFTQHVRPASGEEHDGSASPEGV